MKTPAPQRAASRKKLAAQGQALPDGAIRSVGRAPVLGLSPMRRPGSPWRLLAHEWLGASSGTGFRYGRSYDVSNNPRAAEQRAETARRLSEIKSGTEATPDTTNYTVCEGTEFDELVVGRWIHVEAMDSTVWWMNVGGVTINVTVDRDGRPKVVDVFGPGDYGEPVPGCKYVLTWSAENE